MFHEIQLIFFHSALPPIANVGKHFVRLPWRRDPEPTDFAPLRHHRPRQEMEFLEKKCEQLISSGRAEECYVAHGPIAESLGMKKIKDDGSIRWRLVHNMRVFERVHATTQAQIPNLHEMMEKLTRFKIFSKLDAVSYYDHFPLGKRDAKRTVMRVGNKLLQYLVTPGRERSGDPRRRIHGGAPDARRRRLVRLRLFRQLSGGQHGQRGT
jgi:hypothetical protein